MVGLSIKIPYDEFCNSEQGWAENMGENSSIARVSLKSDISLICGPIELKFCQNVLYSCFYNLIGWIVYRNIPQRDIHLELSIQVCTILSLVSLIDIPYLY